MQVPGAAIIKYHQLRSLRQQESGIKVWAGWLLLEALRKNRSRPLPLLLGASFGISWLWPHHCSLLLHLHMLSPRVSLCLCSPFSYEDTAIGVRAHSESRMISSFVQIRTHSQVPGMRTWTYWRQEGEQDTSQPTLVWVLLATQQAAIAGPGLEASWSTSLSSWYLPASSWRISSSPWPNIGTAVRLWDFSQLYKRRS